LRASYLTLLNFSVYFFSNFLDIAGLIFQRGRRIVRTMNLKVAVNTVSVVVVDIKGDGVAVGSYMNGFDVTAYARYRRTCHEEFIVYRAVRSVTDCTAFPHRLVLKDKWASLLFVALEAFFIPSQQTGT